ncbi:alpha/beta hydrolase family protein [Geomesophilobacter sediminis]|uniref:Alpha/beta hydrolase n=1 Tax=Geomesophilobacter sediminis TaxID=2798584 RepID=A0A8J7JBK0_9BACT|nr:alpha/beta hydrolase [Geomesophilobacter sediminis]MBJ6723968.1 alpha/beta hydrolase [Geomesophilobacter sediminis]
MMRTLTVLFLCLFLAPASTRGADPEYGYPLRSAFGSSIIGTPEKLKPKLPEYVPTRTLELEIFPDRKKPPVFFYDHGLVSTLAYQKKKAPLVFLIASYGASNLSSAQQTLMKTLYQAGFHVITLPSSTHPNFIISASSSSVPGDLTADAVDMYRAMEAAWNAVKHKIEVSDFYLVGTSLGATQAAFVARYDEERQFFKFRKVMLINPSVNLYNSVNMIEALLAKIPGGSNREGEFFNRMLTRFISFYRAGNFVSFNDQFLFAVYQEQLFSNDEAGALIGLSYRVNLAGQIFASDVMTNSGYIVPKNLVLHYTDPLSDYFQVATHLSFFQFFNEYLFPYFRSQNPGLTQDAFIRSQGLKAIDPYLRDNPKFGVITNENDFILAPGELDYLKGLFGPNIKVYPWGGHLGNLEYRDNLAYLVEFLKREGGKP